MTTPPDELRAAVATLRTKAAAAFKNLKASDYYGHDPANFAKGIDNAVGGAAGELAAEFNPTAAHLAADILDALANSWPTAEAHTTTAPAAAARRAALGFARQINRSQP